MEAGLEQKYNFDVVRWFTIMAVVYLVVGALVGVWIASQLAWPILNFDSSYLSFGRLRPVHTSHCENAVAAAQFLQQQPQVAWVRYAGLPDHPDKPLIDKYMGGRASSILSFGIKGGREAGAKFIDALKLAVRLVNIGDAKTLACHPATTTHRQLAPAELARAGVSEDMIRLSIGIEHIDDILEDLAQALAVTH